MTIDLTQIITALIGLLGLVITTFVVPLLKAKMKVENYEILTKWAKVGVLAAEQLWPEGGLGKEKKEYVQNYLRSKGYDINLQEVDMAIESAVYEMKQALEDK